VRARSVHNKGYHWSRLEIVRTTLAEAESQIGNEITSWTESLPGPKYLKSEPR